MVYVHNLNHIVCVLFVFQLSCLRGRHDTPILIPHWILWDLLDIVFRCQRGFSISDQHSVELLSRGPFISVQPACSRWCAQAATVDLPRTLLSLNLSFLVDIHTYILYASQSIPISLSFSLSLSLSPSPPMVAGFSRFPVLLITTCAVHLCNLVTWL